MVSPLLPIGQLLKDAAPELVVVDVGALPHGETVYAPLMSQGLCRVVGFEPADGACETLAEQFGPPHCFLPYVIGDGGEAVSYTHLTLPTICSV